MSEIAVRLTGFWSSAAADPVGVFGGRVFGAASWHHEEREIPDLDMPFHTFTVAKCDQHNKQRKGMRERDFSGPRGTVGFLSAGSSGRWEFRGVTDVTHVYLPIPLIRDVTQEMRASPADPGDLETLNRVEDPLLSGLAREVAASIGETPPPRLYVDQMAQALAFRLVVVQGARPGPQPARGGLASWQLRRVLEFMQDHHAEDLALADLAALVGLSQFHFARAFRQSVGAPPARHLTTIRLERARQMLADPRIPVTEIAGMVGYDSAQTFARAFRREHGTSPTDWRREIVR